MTTRHRWRPRCRIAHGWKKSESFVSQQRDILPCTFIFLSLDSSLSYLFCHSSFLFLFFFFHSHIFSLSLPFYCFFFLFFSILILFSLFLPLFPSFQSSQLFSFLHAYNLKFEINHARDETKLWK
jgi:hypothetical protein